MAFFRTSRGFGDYYSGRNGNVANESVGSGRRRARLPLLLLRMTSQRRPNADEDSAVKDTKNAWPGGRNGARGRGQQDSEEKNTPQRRRQRRRRSEQNSKKKKKNDAAAAGKKEKDTSAASQERRQTKKQQRRPVGGSEGRRERRKGGKEGNDEESEKKQKQSKSRRGRNNTNHIKTRNNNKNKPDAKVGGGGNSEESDQTKQKTKNKLLNLLDPYAAGQRFRQTLDTTLAKTLNDATSLSRTALKPQLDPSRRSIYYLDERLKDDGGVSVGESVLYGAERNPLWEQQVERYSSSTAAAADEEEESIDRRPEVLVVGATGRTGRLIVRRLLLMSNGGNTSDNEEEGVRVRVLVRNLYTSTLEILGTGVTYCVGDLNDVTSLEYACTDVDKIVFCAADDYDNDDGNGGDDSAIGGEEGRSSSSSRSTSRSSRRRSSVDDEGMRNLIHAYQNVRHADYGTSQAAKRSLFRFRNTTNDFALFGIDDDDEDDGTDETMECTWAQNKFGHGVFFGRVPTTSTTRTTTVAAAAAAAEGTGSTPTTNLLENQRDAAKATTTVKMPTVVTGRLRSRRVDADDDEPSLLGVDLSNDGAFAGFVVRLCGDGSVFDMWVETGRGVYASRFVTGSKKARGHHPNGSNSNASRNRFTTVRLPFEEFLRNDDDNKRNSPSSSFHPFDGTDVRRIGFRYVGPGRRRKRINHDSTTRRMPSLSSSIRRNSSSRRRRGMDDDETRFYLSLSYVKVYRSQPEPEFVYLSDARVKPPPSSLTTTMHGGAQNNDVHRSSLSTSLSIEDDIEEAMLYRIIDDSGEERSGASMKKATCKHRGEEILKHSGLSYAIIRVASYNDSPSADSSTIRLQTTDDNVRAVSRADVAQVVTGALLDRNACNLSFYMTKADVPTAGETLTNKLQRLRREIS